MSLIPLDRPITIFQESNKVDPITGKRKIHTYHNVVGIKKSRIQLPQATFPSPAIELHMEDKKGKDVLKKVHLSYFRSEVMRNVAMLRLMNTTDSEIYLSFDTYFARPMISDEHRQMIDKYEVDANYLRKNEDRINSISPIPIDIDKLVNRIPWDNVTTVVTACAFLFGAPIQGMQPDVFWYNYFHT